MKLPNPRRKQVRVLILEDEPEQASNRKAALEERFNDELTMRFKSCELSFLVCEAADSLTAALQNLHFHFVLLDLRVPMKPGDPIGDEAIGIREFSMILRSREQLGSLKYLHPGAVITNFSRQLHDAGHEAGKIGLEFWQKAAGDLNPRLPVPQLDEANLARFVFDRLQAWGPAQHRLLEGLIGLLPAPMARVCEQVQVVCVAGEEWERARDNQTEQQKLLDEKRDLREHSRDALWAACRLGEMAKEWLFAVLAAHLTLHGLLPVEVGKHAVERNASSGENQDRREKLIDTMLDALVTWQLGQQEGQPFSCARLFSHLDVVPEADNRGFECVAALRSLRQMRNALAHQEVKPPYDDKWASIALPVWRVLDALSFFGRHAILNPVRAMAPGFVMAQRLLAAKQTEAQLAVRTSRPGAAAGSGLRIDPRQVYLLWPGTGESSDLLPLWPWVARLPAAQGEHLQTYFYAGRNDKGFPVGLSADSWKLETFRDGEAALTWKQALDALGVNG